MRTPDANGCAVPQILFRGTITPDGKPSIERCNVENEAERAQALAQGWILDEHTASQEAQYKKLEYVGQQRRDHEAASRRREERLDKLLDRVEDAPQSSREMGAVSERAAEPPVLSSATWTMLKSGS